MKQSSMSEDWNKTIIKQGPTWPSTTNPVREGFNVLVKRKMCTVSFFFFYQINRKMHHHDPYEFM